MTRGQRGSLLLHCDGLAPSTSCRSPGAPWLNHKPHAIAMYASWPALPSAHATLATGRPATALPGPVFHRLDCTSFCWRLRKGGLNSKLLSVMGSRAVASVGY